MHIAFSHLFQTQHFFRELWERRNVLTPLLIGWTSLCMSQHVCQRCSGGTIMDGFTSVMRRLYRSSRIFQTLRRTHVCAQWLAKFKSFYRLSLGNNAILHRAGTGTQITNSEGNGTSQARKTWAHSPTCNPQPVRRRSRRTCLIGGNVKRT